MLHAVGNRKKNYGPHRPGRCLPASGECFVRYDNERGKGDHRHAGGIETRYEFTDLDTLLALAQAA